MCFRLVAVLSAALLTLTMVAGAALAAGDAPEAAPQRLTTAPGPLVTPACAHDPTPCSPA